MKDFIFTPSTLPFSSQIFYTFKSPNKFRLGLTTINIKTARLLMSQLHAEKKSKLFPKVYLTIKSNSRPFQKHFPPRGIWNKFIAASAPYFQTDLMPDFRISSKNKKANSITFLQILISFYT